MTGDSVFAAFKAAAGHWPARPFLNVLPETAAVYGIDAGRITYAEALSQVDALSARLIGAGAGRGQRLMLLLENRPAFFLWWLAANRLGLSVVPINPDLRVTELTHMIAMTRPALAITVPERADDLRAAADKAGHALPVAGTEDALPPVSPGVVFDPGHDPRLAEAAILFTSGSTGKPKGCVLPNEYFLCAGDWYATEGGLCALTREGARMLTPLPVFHMNAMAYSLMAMIAVGGCLTALDRFHPRTWWDSVRASRATCLHYLGVMPSMLMGLPEGPGDRDHTVRFGFGAGVDPKLHAAFEARFGFPLVEAWAMTETGAGAVIAASQMPRQVGVSALGVPGGAMQMRIVGDDGADAEQGELLVRATGPDPKRGFFRAYLNDPQATAEAWEGGWFHTGDIVRRGQGGQIHFVDRRKNVIRRSGENIAAVEVESVLARHPDVAAVGVTSVSDAIRGDEVFALIVPKSAPGPDLAARIVEWALGQMAYYKPPGWVAFADALPLTATQKLQRAELKAMAAALLDDPAIVDLRAMKKRGAA